VDKVLTPEQRKNWKEMKGEEYEGKLTLTGLMNRNTRAAALPARCLYLAEPSVQTELKMTKEQVAGVRGLEAKWLQLTKDHAAWKPPERAGELAKATEAMDAHVGQLLQQPQAKRFEQILMQNLRLVRGDGPGEATVATISRPPLGTRRAEKSGLAELLAYAPAAKALALSDDQRQQAGAALADFRQTRELIDRQLGRDSLATEARLATTQAALRERAEKQMEKLLTDKQRAAVKDLVGEPFTVAPGGRSRGTSRRGGIWPRK
jgi:hypothetical protein